LEIASDLPTGAVSSLKRVSRNIFRYDHTVISHVCKFGDPHFLAMTEVTDEPIKEEAEEVPQEESPPEDKAPPPPAEEAPELVVVVKDDAPAQDEEPQDDEETAMQSERDRLGYDSTPSPSRPPTTRPSMKNHRHMSELIEPSSRNLMQMTPQRPAARPRPSRSVSILMETGTTTAISPHHRRSSITPDPFEVSYHPGGFQLYRPPKQRQRWGQQQVLPRVNWGDLFFDLFYVAAAYNVST
jgi:hypothetical protein